MKQHAARLNRRGSIMVWAMVITAGSLIATATLCQRSLGEVRLHTHNVNLKNAFWLAESAVNEAMENLVEEDASDIAEKSFAGGAYAATVTPLSGSIYQINALGSSGITQSGIETVVQRVPKSLFQYALFGDYQVSVGGSVYTDSFDSREAAYDEETAEDDGNVGTNAAAIGAIDVTGSVYVNGHLSVGASAENPETVVTYSGTSYTVTGDPAVVTALEDLPMPSVNVPASLACQDLEVGAQEVYTLSSATGEYCFNNLTLQGGGTLTSDGPVTVYINGALVANGNTVVGSPANPDWLLVQIASSGQGVLGASLTGSMQYYGGLYAPDALIEINGNTQVYGAVTAYEIDVSGNAEIHYDVALSESERLLWQNTMEVLMWREI